MRECDVANRMTSEMDDESEEEDEVVAVPSQEMVDEEFPLNLFI